MDANAKLVNKLSGHKYWQRSLDYVTDVGRHKLATILATLEKISPKLKEDVLTTAQRLRREGQEGVQTRSLEIAKKMLAKGYPVDAIRELTGLSMEELAEATQRPLYGLSL